MPSTPTPAGEAFKEHRRVLWALAYRMMGSAADADDVLQETFVRAVERPPPRVDEPLRPWLIQVAVNVARDALRRRKRRGYVGPWLPSPVEGIEALEDLPATAADARYAARESASYAFLVAVEALNPQQRAVLLLRDALDYSVQETAAALGLSAGNVKTTHHRARRVMETYDATRRPSVANIAAETRVALERFLGAILNQDAAAAAACLAEGARLVSDGGGEFHAALRPVIGPDRIARFFLGLTAKLGPPAKLDVRSLNGLPAVVIDYDHSASLRAWGPRCVVRCDVDAAGAISAVHVVVASAKLHRVA